MSSTRSKGETNLTNFTNDPEKIGRNKTRRRSKRMADIGNTDPQHREIEEDHQEPHDDETGDTDTVEMYLPDLDNTPLSQGLKNRLDYGLEDEVMIVVGLLGPRAMRVSGTAETECALGKPSV